MSNDRDRELRGGVKGFSNQGESSAGRGEAGAVGNVGGVVRRRRFVSGTLDPATRYAAGILGGRTGTGEDEHEDGERTSWGWAVGTVVPDEPKPVQHDAAGDRESVARAFVAVLPVDVDQRCAASEREPVALELVPVLPAEVDQRYAASERERTVSEDVDQRAAARAFVSVLSAGSGQRHEPFIDHKASARAYASVLSDASDEAGDDDGADEDLLRIVIGEPRRSAARTSVRPRRQADQVSLLGDETDVDVRIDPTLEMSIDIGGDTQVDIARGPAALDADDDTDDFDDEEDDLDDEEDLDDEDAGGDDDDGELDDGVIDAAGVDAPPVSRKNRPRHRRRDRPRSKTIALKRLTREELRRGALENPPIEGLERPHTRAECADAPRPCPWVACKHHLYLDINPRTGSIKINFPDLEPWELQHTCALDVADSGGLTLEEIGVITNLTRERVRQVEVRGLLTLKARSRSLR